MILRSEEFAHRAGEVAGRAASPARQALGRGAVGGWGDATARFRNRVIGLVRHSWLALTLSSLVGHLSLFAVLLVSLGRSRRRSQPPPRQARRRRPSGAPPPLHHLHTTGLGWLLVVTAVATATVAVFRGGVDGPAIAVTVVDDAVVRWISGLEAPGLHTAARVVAAASSWWTIQFLVLGVQLGLLVLRRWRHLLVAMVVIQVAQLAAQSISTVAARPRPFGVPLEAGWGGYAMPSHQMLATTGMLVLVLYTFVPEGRWRNAGKWVLAAVLPLVAVARIHLGVDAPGDIIVATAIAVAFPVVAFRVFVPNEVFPVSYRQGRSAHLDVGGLRSSAIRQAVGEQLGFAVSEIRPVGLSGSAGSTPLRLRIEGTPEYLFGKLYSKTHLRSDRWYKLGRELLYGRLEDEKPFNAVRRLVQQEGYALRLVRDAGLPSAAPYGFVELTPEREYLLVTEFFDGAVELGEATVDDALIDDGLRLIRQLWDAGLAHRDIKPSCHPSDGTATSCTGCGASSPTGDRRARRAASRVMMPSSTRRSWRCWPRQW